MDDMRNPLTATTSAGFGTITNNSRPVLQWIPMDGSMSKGAAWTRIS